MSDIQELVEKVIAAKRGDVIWPPADAASVEAVRRYIHSTFGIELPSSYVALVSRTDGLEYNSYVIFGTTSHRDPYLPSVQELNQVLFNEPKPHAFFGETADELFAYCPEDGIWRALDRPSLSPLEVFDDFDTMLLHILKRAYD